MVYATLLKLPFQLSAARIPDRRGAYTFRSAASVRGTSNGPLKSGAVEAGMSPRWTITPSWRRALPPGFIVPMQPSLVVRVPEGPDWQHEIKHDGYRLIARKEGPSIPLWSRTGRDWRGAFTGIAEAVAALPATSLILDGEAVVLREDGTSDLFALRSPRGRTDAP